MKKKNISEYMSEFGIIKIDKRLGLGEVLEFSNVIPCQINIQNASWDTVLGVYKVASGAVAAISATSGVSINENSNAYLQIKAEGNILKIINTGVVNSPYVRAMIFKV